MTSNDKANRVSRSYFGNDAVDVWRIAPALWKWRVVYGWREGDANKLDGVVTYPSRRAAMTAAKAAVSA